MAHSLRTYSDADLNPAMLPGKLRDAEPTIADRADNPRGSEERRASAVQWLIAFRRRRIWEDARSLPGWEETAEQVLVEFAAAVRVFFQAHMDKILDAADPVAAMAQFVGGTKSRGRPSASDARNLEIAVEVELRHKEGMTVEDAAASLASASELKLSEERVSEIYYAARKTPEGRRAIAAEIGLLAMDWLESRDETESVVPWGKLRRIDPSEPPLKS
jgi:hypothetical protein